MKAPPITTTARLRALPDEPTHAELLPLAHDFAMAAASARYSEKSLSASLRMVKAERADLLPQIEQEARAHLASLRQSVPAEPPMVLSTSRWLTELQVAERLDKSPAAMRECLATVEGRMGLGWPWYDGRRWRIPEPAISPETRAGYMATIPATEPPAHVATLPAWCSRMSTGRVSP